MNGNRNEISLYEFKNDLKTKRIPHIVELINEFM